METLERVRRCGRTSVKSGASIMQRGGCEVRSRCTRSRGCNLPSLDLPRPLASPLVHAANQLDTRRNAVTFIADVSENRTPRRRPSGNIADFAGTPAWVDDDDETRNPLAVDFSECLRINRRTVLVDFRTRLLVSKRTDTQLFRELNSRGRITPPGDAPIK